MSKPVKNMITEVYRQRLGDLDQAMVVDVRGIEANENNAMRSALAQKEIRLTVVKNALVRRALSGSGVERLNDLIDGPSAIVYGGESVVEIARELIDWAERVEQLELKGAVMEGVVFGPDQIEELSKYPTRQEAQAQAVQLVLSPAQRLVGAVRGPGSKVASLIKAVEQKRENGDEI